MILFDAHTSGGLLITVSQKEADKALEMLHDSGYECAKIVGEAVCRSDEPITVF